MEKARAIFYIVGSIAIVLAAIIGLTLHFTLTSDDVTSRDDVVVNCLPQTDDPTKSQCEDMR